MLLLCNCKNVIFYGRQFNNACNFNNKCFDYVRKAADDYDMWINIWKMANALYDKDNVPFWVIHYDVRNNSSTILLYIIFCLTYYVIMYY